MTHQPAGGEQVKPVKLMDTDNIEAYLTMFKCMVQVAYVEET